MVGQEIFIMNLVFELLFSEGDHNHIFGEYLKRMVHCYLLEAEQAWPGARRNTFLVLLSTLRPARRKGYVSG